MRAAGYTRVSMGEQVKGHSLEAQTHSIQSFCAHRDWTLVRIYTDAGHSARRESLRPDFERMLQDARAGHFDVLIVDKLDRFYRHLRGCLTTLDELRSCGVTFVSVRENLDFSTPWGKLTLTVLGMLAEIYIDNLRDETRKGKLQRARKGLHNGSAPLGYCRGNCSSCTDPNGPDYCPRYNGPNIQAYTAAHPLVHHPVESTAVELAFEWYLSGDFSDGDIADRINDYAHTLPDGSTIHFRTKGRPGRFPPSPFSKESVRHLLQRPFYTGLIPYYGKDAKGRKKKRDQVTSVFPGQHEPLVSSDDFQQAQKLRQRLAHRSRQATSRKPNIYPLSGLLICDSCGRPMRATGAAGKYRYYRDTTNIEHRGKCDQPTLRAEEIEGQVVAFLRSLSQRLPPDWRERVMEMLLPPERRAEIDEQEQDVAARIERATRLFLEGHIDHERFLDEKRRAQATRADLRPARIDDIICVGETLEAFDLHWEEADTPLTKNGLLRLVFAGVRVQRYELSTAQATLACFPLVRLLLCRNGSDGDGTRQYLNYSASY
ncbi:MAG: recombinase family protein [Chloroflexi bacterium]|nr:recombinase family protein [Chloroflexota bacterium]